MHRMPNTIRLVSLAVNLFKKNKLDEEDQAKIEEEEKENAIRKRYERLFKIKRNGCNEYMLTLALHERNIENIKVKEYLNRPSKIIMLNKNKLLTQIKTNT